MIRLLFQRSLLLATSAALMISYRHYFFFPAAASAAFFASAKDLLICVTSRMHVGKFYEPAACFSRIFAATFSFSRCISGPDMEVPLFCEQERVSQGAVSLHRAYQRSGER